MCVAYKIIKLNVSFRVAQNNYRVQTKKIMISFDVKMNRKKQQTTQKCHKSVSAVHCMRLRTHSRDSRLNCNSQKHKLHYKRDIETKMKSFMILQKLH